MLERPSSWKGSALADRLPLSVPSFACSFQRTIQNQRWRTTWEDRERKTTRGCYLRNRRCSSVAKQSNAKKSTVCDCGWFDFLHPFWYKSRRVLRDYSSITSAVVDSWQLFQQNDLGHKAHGTWNTERAVQLRFSTVAYSHRVHHGIMDQTVSLPRFSVQRTVHALQYETCEGGIQT